MAGKISRQANAVVTGAGSGIGRAFALELARRNGRVVCADIDLAAARATAMEIERGGGRSFAVACDVAEAQQVVDLANAAAQFFGSETTLLINNAGVGVGGRIGEIPINEWRWIMGVNLWGVIHGCETFVPRFRATGTGGIINVASMAGFIAAPEMGPYSVTKFGVVALSETLAEELQGTAIHVTTLCPTFVKTNIVRNARGGTDKLGLAQKLMDRTGMDPARVAAQTLDGLDRGELYVIPQLNAKLLWRMKRLLPKGMARGLGLAYRFGQ